MDSHHGWSIVFVIANIIWNDPSGIKTVSTLLAVMQEVSLASLDCAQRAML